MLLLILSIVSFLWSLGSAEYLWLQTWFIPHSEIELLFSKRIAPFQIHCAAITRSMEAKFLIESNGLFSSVIYAGEEVQVLWPEDGNNPATADSSDKLKTTGWKIEGGISEQHCNISSPSIIFQAQNCGEKSRIIMTKEHQVTADCRLWGGRVFTWWWAPSGFYPGNGNYPVLPPPLAPRVIECRSSSVYPGITPALPRSPGEPPASAGCFSF